MGALERSVSDHVDGFLDDLILRDRQVAREVTEELVRSIPAYADAARELSEGIEETVRRTYGTLVTLWRERRPLMPAELEPLVRMGLPPARYGITLEDVLHAYRLAAKVIHGHIEQVGPRYDLEPTFLITCSQLMWQYLDDLSTGLTGRWRQHERDQHRWREDLEQTLVQAVLDEPTDLDQATRVARALGVALAASEWRIVVAEPPGLEPGEVGTLVERARAWLRRGDQQPLVGRVEHYGVVLAEGGRVDGVVAALEPLATLGVSRRVSAVPDLRQAYLEAKALVALAHRQSATVRRFEDTWVERFLLGTVAPREFVSAMLAPLDALADGRRRSLMETLEAYLSHQGRVTAMAQALHLHPQSVRYRLKQLRKTLGKALDSPSGRLGLHIAIEQRRLMGGGTDREARG